MGSVLGILFGVTSSASEGMVFSETALSPDGSDSGGISIGGVDDGAEVELSFVASVVMSCVTDNTITDFMNLASRLTK
jgi:hypothetical protein